VKSLASGEGLLEQFVAVPESRTLRAVTAGSGDPVVVFEAGMGAAASSWIPVQRLVSKRLRTVAYDRAGFGGSDPDPAPRTLGRISSDLRALLDGLELGGPVVLVGHSWGGPIIRSFAHTHPSAVAGLVLVDATVPAAMSAKQAKALAGVFSVVSGLSRVGLHKPLVRLSLRDSFDVDAADAALMRRDALSAESARTGRREAAEAPAGIALVERYLEEGLPDVPVTTISGTSMAGQDRKIRPALLAFNEQEMAAHPQGRFVRAERSGHLVPQTQPDLVAAEVLALADRCGA
jgi:pimeloyl-ACP methyl ester carboxylesterase